MGDDWFEVDDAEVDDRQKAFVDCVRSYARNWPECLPRHTTVLVYEPGEEVEDDESEKDKGELRLIVDVGDVSQKRVLLTLGAFLVEDKLLCSSVHSQTYWPEENSLVATVTSAGDPEELGGIAAAWFEEILRRPVIEKIRGRNGWSFVPPGSSLPKGYRWVRGASSPEQG